MRENDSKNQNCAHNQDKHPLVIFLMDFKGIALAIPGLQKLWSQKGTSLS